MHLVSEKEDDSFDDMDDLLRILRSAEDVISSPASSTPKNGSSRFMFSNSNNTVAGFHPSMIPFPDPIKDTVVKQSSYPLLPVSFPRPLGKLTGRHVTPDAEESLMGATTAVPISSMSFPKPLGKLSGRQITPDGVEFFDEAVATGPCSINRLPVNSTPSWSSADSFSSLIFDDDEREIVHDPSDALTSDDIFSFAVEEEEEEDIFQPLPLEMPTPVRSDNSTFASSVRPSPIPLYALCSFGGNGTVNAETVSDKARPQRYQQGPWNTRLQELLDFQKEHGHAMVPHLYKKNPQLSQWVKRQRYQYRLKKMGKHSTLSDEREELLIHMGFVFESHKTSWNESFLQLQAFYLKYGHSRVTKTNADESLNTWAKHQRRQYKRFVCGQSSHMTVERIQQLESLQFDWDPRNILSSGASR
jgi:hypothetical protein